MVCSKKQREMLLDVHLLAFERLQDGEVSRVLQREDDDFASVVESWSSCY